MILPTDATTRYKITAQQLEAAITPRTRAIVPVHFAGQPAEMDARHAARRYDVEQGVAVHHDAAGFQLPGPPFHQTRMYLEETGGHVSYLTLVVRAACAPGAACDAAALAVPIRAAARDLAPGLPVTDVQTLARVVRDENAQPRFNAILLSLFAAVALALAAVGIYGVMSYAVARRTHEIGLRMALGARAADVQRLVVGRAMALTLLGTALGTPA